MAPNSQAELVRWSSGAAGRAPRLAQRRVILFFWPMGASSCHRDLASARLRPLVDTIFA